MQDHGFRSVMIQMTDEELYDILENRRDEYQENALLDIKAILEERGVSDGLPTYTHNFFLIEDNQRDLNIDEKREFIYAPLIVGLLFVMVVIFVVPININTSVTNARTFNIAANITIRVICFVWVIALSERFGLKKGLWIMLGLLFGGWSLIAINVVSWFKDDLGAKDSKRSKNQNSSIIQEEKTQGEKTIQELEREVEEKRYNKFIALITKVVLLILGLFVLLVVAMQLNK